MLTRPRSPLPRFAIALSCIFIFADLLPAQPRADPRIAEIEAELAAETNDTIRLDLMIDLARAWRGLNSDSLRTIGERALALAGDMALPDRRLAAARVITYYYFEPENRDSLAHLARRWLETGIYEMNDGLAALGARQTALGWQDAGAGRDTVMHYFDLALLFSMGDSSETCYILLDKARYDHLRGNFPHAIAEAQEAISLVDPRDDRNYFRLLEMLRRIHFEQDDIPKADVYANQIMKNWSSFSLKNLLPHLLVSQTDFYIATNRPEQALATILIADSVRQTFPPSSRYEDVRLYLGMALRLNGELEKAKAIFTELQASGTLRRNLQVVLLQEFGELMLQLNRPREAIRYCEKSLQIARETDIFALVGFSCTCLVKGYKATGDGMKAIRYLEERQALDDSLKNVSNIQKMAVLEQEVEARSREKALIALRENENALAEADRIRAAQFRNSLLIALALILLVLFQVYRNSLQRKRTNEALKFKNDVIACALREKGALLGEIHHRVKNNLQMVSNLLDLQTRYMEDGTARAAISEGQNRLQSVALIHQQLYSSGNRTTVNMLAFVHELLRELDFSSGAGQKGITFSSNIQNMDLDVEKAVPLGLMLNEMITNALKYAFQGRETGQIQVILAREGQSEIQLRVMDDGIGISETAKEGLEKSYGMRLIRLFAQELSGVLDIQADNGTCINFTFPSAA